MSHDLENHIASFSTWVRTAFPDLAFLAPGGELRINERLENVVGLRIQLPGKQFLHLHSLSIDGFDAVELTAATTCTQSSVHPGYEKRLEEGVLFQPEGKHQVGFHTDRDDGAWLDISFRSPVVFSGLVLRNVPGDTSRRARGLQVLSTSADGECTVLYDGAARSEEFSSRVASKRRHEDPDLSVSSAELDVLLRDVALCHYQSATRQLKTLTGAAGSDRRRIRATVNDSLLADSAVEWNIHAVRRTFRYWTTSERRDYVRRATELIRDLEDLTDKVCLGFGGVLGLVREGGLLGHDDDLDVIIGLESHEAASLADGIQLVRDFLQPRGYRVWGDQLAHQFVRRGDSPKIDLFVGLFEGNHIAWYPSARRSLTREDLFPPLRTPLLGEVCAIPRNPLIYLEKVYGPAWRVPDPGYSHRWGRKPYEDIAGTLT